MATRKILTLGDESLRKVCKKQEKFDLRLAILLKDLADTMYKAEGVGLAAPQVGILRRVVVVDVSEDQDELLELINPEILETSGSQIDDEGCLSLPGKYAPVERPNYAKVKYMDRNGDEYIIEGEALMARALCHEIDHLDGILYIDKALPVEEA